MGSTFVDLDAVVDPSARDPGVHWSGQLQVVIGSLPT